MPNIPIDIINELKTSHRKPKVITVFRDKDNVIRLAFGEERGLLFENSSLETAWINNHNADDNEAIDDIPEPFKLYPFLHSVGKIKHKVDIDTKKMVIPNVSIKMHNFGIDRKIFEDDYYSWGNGQFAYSLVDEFLTDMVANPYWKKGTGKVGTSDNVHVSLLAEQNDQFVNFEKGWGSQFEQVLFNMIGMTVSIYYATDYSRNKSTDTISLERCANMQAIAIKSYKQDPKYVTLKCESSFSQIAQKKIELNKFNTNYETSDKKYIPIVLGDNRYHTLYATGEDEGIEFSYQDSEYGNHTNPATESVVVLEEGKKYPVPAQTLEQSIAFGEKSGIFNGEESGDIYKYRKPEYKDSYLQWVSQSDKVMFPFRQDASRASYSENNLVYVTYKETPNISSFFTGTDASANLETPYVIQFCPMRSISHQDKAVGGQNNFGVIGEMAEIMDFNGGVSVEGGVTSVGFMEAKVVGVNRISSDEPSAKGHIGVVRLNTSEHVTSDDSVVDIRVNIESGFRWFPYYFPNGQLAGQAYGSKLSSYLVSFSLGKRYGEELLQRAYDIANTLIPAYFLTGMNADSDGYPELLMDDVVEGVLDDNLLKLGGGDSELETSSPFGGFSKKYQFRDWADDADYTTQEEIPFYEVQNDRYDVDDFYGRNWLSGSLNSFLLTGENVFSKTFNISLIPNSGLSTVDDSLDGQTYGAYTSLEPYPQNDDGEDVYAHASAFLDIEKLNLTYHFLKPELSDSVGRLYAKADGATMADLSDYLDTILDYRNYPIMQVAYLWKKLLGIDFMGVEQMDYKYQIQYQALNTDGTVTQSYPNTSNYLIDEPKSLMGVTEDLLRHTNTFPFLITSGAQEKLASFLIKETYVGSEPVYDFRLIDIDYKKISIETTPISKVCTGAKVVYGGEELEMGLDKVVETEQKTAQDFYPEYSYDFYNLAEGDGLVTLECPNINSIEEAERYRDFYIKNNCNQKIKLKITLPLKYIDLHIGSVIRFDYLPENMRVLGKDYTTSWYSQMIANNIDFEDVGFGEIPEEMFQYDDAFKRNEIQINGQYFLPFFVINNCEYTVESIQIEAIQLMHLKDAYGAPPQPCDDGVCYNPDEVFFPVEGCTIPYADNFSLSANTPTNSICEFASTVEQVPPAYIDASGVKRAGWVDIKLKEQQLVIPYEDNTEQFYTNSKLYGDSTATEPDATKDMATRADNLEPQCSTIPDFAYAHSPLSAFTTYKKFNHMNGDRGYFTYPYAYAPIMIIDNHDTREYNTGYGVNNDGQMTLVRYSDFIPLRTPNIPVDIHLSAFGNAMGNFTIFSHNPYRYDEDYRVFASLLMWYHYYVEQNYFEISMIGYPVNVFSEIPVSVGNFVNSWGIVRDGEDYIYTANGESAEAGYLLLAGLYQSHIQDVVAEAGGLDYIMFILSDQSTETKNIGALIRHELLENIRNNVNPVEGYFQGVSTENPVTAGGEPVKMLWQFNYSQRTGIYTDYSPLINSNNRVQIGEALDGNVYENAWGVPIGRWAIPDADNDTKYTDETSEGFNWIGWNTIHNGQAESPLQETFRIDRDLRFGNPSGVIYQDPQETGFPESDSGLPICAVQRRTHKNPYQNQTGVTDFIAFATENFGFSSHPSQLVQSIRSYDEFGHSHPTGLFNHKNNTPAPATSYIRIWNYSTSPIEIPFNTKCYERSWDSNTDPALYGDFVYQNGDVNMDGTLDILDVVNLVLLVMGELSVTDEQYVIGDGFTGDGIINILDVVSVVNHILGGDDG